MTINFEQFRKDAKIERIDDRITRFISWYDSCCCYLIEDRRNVLIDASYPLMKPLSDIMVDIILLTHPHCDHPTFAKEIAEAVGSKVYASRGTAEWFRKYGNEIIPKDRTDVKEILAKYKTPPEVYPPKIDRIIKEGDVINTGSLALRVIETPGHSPGDLCFLEEERGTFFSGDALLKIKENGELKTGGWKVNGRVLRDSNRKLLEKSVIKLKSIKFGMLCPGHVY